MSLKSDDEEALLSEDIAMSFATTIAGVAFNSFVVCGLTREIEQSLVKTFVCRCGSLVSRTTMMYSLATTYKGHATGLIKFMYRSGFLGALFLLLHNVGIVNMRAFRQT